MRVTYRRTVASSDVTVERFAVSDRSFRPHTHDEFVLSLNSSMVVRESIRLDRDRFSVGAGSVTTYNPNQVQSSTAETAGAIPWECVSVYASQSIVAGLVGSAGGFSSAVAQGPRVALGIRRALTEAGTGGKEWALWALSIALSPHPITNPRAPMTPLALPVSLDWLCEQLGASRDNVVRAFVRDAGVPPYAWHLQRRLREGQRLLRGGSKVADVAAELGFADQAHFHRLYRQAYARTPGADHRPA